MITITCTGRADSPHEPVTVAHLSPGTLPDIRPAEGVNAGQHMHAVGWPQGVWGIGGDDHVTLSSVEHHPPEESVIHIDGKPVEEPTDDLWWGESERAGHPHISVYGGALRGRDRWVKFEFVCPDCGFVVKATHRHLFAVLDKLAAATVTELSLAGLNRALSMARTALKTADISVEERQRAEPDSVLLDLHPEDLIRPD